MTASAAMTRSSGAQALHCRFVRSEELSGIKSEWNSLVSRMEIPCPFLSWEWVTTWLSENPRLLQSVRIVGAWNGSKLIGLLPLYLDNHVLRVIAAQEVCADYIDVIAASDDISRVIEGFAELLNSDSGWTAAHFEGFRRPSAIATLVLALKGRGVFREVGPCPATDVSGGWGEYLQRRFSKKRRYNIIRDLRLGAERHGLVVRSPGEAGELGSAVASLFALHRERKAAQGIESTFASAGMESFHRSLASALQASGMLILDIVEKDGIPVAALYGFRTPRKVWLYQTGVSAVGMELGAGAFALAHRLSKASKDGVESFDFLRGDEPYKRLWADSAETMWSATHYRAAWRGVLAQTFHNAGKWFPRCARRVSGGDSGPAE